MLMRPTLEISNDPRYQEKTAWSRLLLNEETRDDNDQPCNILGGYDFATGAILFDVYDFKMVAHVSGYEPVINDLVKKEIIVSLLKEKHGRNVNFV